MVIAHDKTPFYSIRAVGSQMSIACFIGEEQMAERTDLGIIDCARMIKEHCVKHVGCAQCVFRDRWAGPKGSDKCILGYSPYQWDTELINERYQRIKADELPERLHPF